MRTWTIREVRSAVLRATFELDVPAVSADQYRAWRASQPEPGDWPAVNTVKRVADDYGTAAFHVPSGNSSGGRRWSDRRIRDSLLDSRAVGAIDYKNWRARQPNPGAHPSWSIAYRRGMAGVIDANRRARVTQPARGSTRQPSR